MRCRLNTSSRIWLLRQETSGRAKFIRKRFRLAPKMKPPMMPFHCLISVENLKASGGKACKKEENRDRSTSPSNQRYCTITTGLDLFDNHSTENRNTVVLKECLFGWATSTHWQEIFYYAWYSLDPKLNCCILLASSSTRSSSLVPCPCHS